MATTSAINILLERNNKLIALSENGTLPANILARLADTTVRPYLSDVKNEVHSDGIEKKYSSKEAWFGATSFYKKSANKKVGKHGDKTKSTMYFPDGYTGLRNVQGFKTDKVYVEVSGDLKNSIQIQSLNGENIIGIIDISQVGKWRGLKKKYKSLYVASKETLNKLHERTANEIQVITKEVMNG